MNKQYDGYQVVPFPKARRALIDVMRSGQHMHVIHALLEVDITKARAYLREQTARFAQRLKELIESGYGLIEQEATSALQESKQEPTAQAVSE